MTREEEIKDRQSKYAATYYTDDPEIANQAEDDIRYLLARNEELTAKYRSALDKISDLEADIGTYLREKEELKRRVEKMRAVMDVARKAAHSYFHPLSGDGKSAEHMSRLYKEIGILDAKEQDDV